MTNQAFSVLQTKILMLRQVKITDNDSFLYRIKVTSPFKVSTLLPTR